MPVEHNGRTVGLFPIFVREGRSRKRYKAGYINRYGEVVIPAIFDHAYPFRNGLASVKKSDLWGAIDSRGELVIPIRFSGPLVFTERLAPFGLPNLAGGNKKELSPQAEKSF